MVRISVRTITSTITVNIQITSLSDLNVLNLDISHIWTADLTIKLKSPQGTEITLLAEVCGDQDNILINFDDEATANIAKLITDKEIEDNPS